MARRPGRVSYAGQPVATRSLDVADNLLRSKWRTAQAFREKEALARRYLWMSPPNFLDQGWYIWHLVRGAFLFDVPRDSGYVVLPVLLTLTICLYACSASLAAVYPPCVDAMLEAHPGTEYGRVKDADGQFNGSASVMWLIMNDISMSQCHEVLVLAPWGALLSGPATAYSRGARLLTYSLAHFSVTHLVENMACIVPLLAYLESRYGSMLMAMSTTIGVLSASFLSLSLVEEGYVIAGASSILYALAGVLTFDASVNYVWNHAWLINSIAALGAIIALIISSVSESQVTAIAHIGGFVGGLGFALALFPRFTDFRPKGDTSGQGEDVELADRDPLGNDMPEGLPWILPVLPIASRHRADVWRYAVSRAFGKIILALMLVVAPLSAYTRSYA